MIFIAHDYVAIATCKYHNGSLDNLETETIVITKIETFAEAMAKVESYYGDDLESVTITLKAGPYFKISNQGEIE